MDFAYVAYMMFQLPVWASFHVGSYFLGAKSHMIMQMSTNQETLIIRVLISTDKIGTTAHSDGLVLVLFHLLASSMHEDLTNKFYNKVNNSI